MRENIVKIKNLVNDLETKTGLFFVSRYYTYMTLESLIRGYLMCLDDCFYTKYNNQFQEWLVKKHSPSSLAWPVYIYEVLANKNDDEAKMILLRELKLYLQESV